MQIIYAINSRVLREARKAGLDDRAIAAISLIDEGGERRVRMANLAFVGAHSINGVAALHTELMKSTVFADLHALYPTRINNKTNGVTPRRWLQQCNPRLVGVIKDAIGDAFLDDAEKLSDLNALATDAQLGERIAEVKRANKVALAGHLKQLTGIRIDPDALFDVQIKRIHEYKRQLLNLIETVALYDQIRSHPERDWTPRVKIFGGKAAPSYHNAKLVIKLANDIARRINSDPSVGGLLKVVFVPNYNVTLAERIIPAADLSEQISTAGMEASGTGNMKFALNGALTIGTLDGANIEIKDRVGDDNIVIFGLTAEEVAQTRADGYNPRAIIEGSRELQQAISAIASGVFSPDDPHRYTGLMGGLYDSDWFMVAADFDAYHAAQRGVDARWEDQAGWRASAIRNIANVGWFSSDRTIGEYARDIWESDILTLHPRPRPLQRCSTAAMPILSRCWGCIPALPAPMPAPFCPGPNVSKPLPWTVPRWGCWKGRSAWPVRRTGGGRTPAGAVSLPGRPLCLGGDRPLFVRAGAGADRRFPDRRRHPPPPVRQAGRPCDRPRRRARRAFRGLGAQCPAGERGGRFQRLGRHAPPHAPPHRYRHLGTVPARHRRRPPTSTASSVPMARCSPTRPIPLPLLPNCARTPPRSRSTPRRTNGATRPIARSGPRPTRAACRSRSMKCIPDRGASRAMGASSIAGMSWPTA
jgi:hypothetical protein